MIQRLGARFATFFRATTPDPMVLAIALTAVVFALAALIEGQGPLEIIEAWQNPKTGFWSLLGFGMQMVLILVTGHALTKAPIATRALRRLARLPRTGPQAAALVSFVAIAAALLNWGLGLIVGAILAREVGQSCHERNVRIHYPLVVAAGYTGLMAWHGGFSGTAPLKMTTEADVKAFLGEDLAARVDPVAFTDSVLGPMNLIVSGGLLVLVPMVIFALAPRRPEHMAQSIEAFPPPPSSLPATMRSDLTRIERIEHSPITMAIIAIPLVIANVVWGIEQGLGRLEPNALNLFFLTAGLILHGSVRAYADAVGEAVRGASGIVLQFPFYAGIMGVMRATGLGTTVAQTIASLVPAKLYAVATMFSAALINLFVPSGGGQWAVQGPVAVETGLSVGAPLELSIMAVAYGDQLTNMLQPFWALPLLAITGVKARDIIGYTAIIMIAGAAWIGGCLLAFS